MLDDRARGRLEGLRQLARRVEVQQVVERELLAVQLVDAVQQVRGRAYARVEGRALVWVLAVAQIAELLVRIGPGRREARPVHAHREPAGDRHVVARGTCERLRRQTRAGRK